MASNPAPTDLSTSQLVIDATSGALRRRADEERTAAGAGIEHNKFIYCPALGVSGEGEDEVRALRACCHCAPTCTHVHPPMCACVCSPIGALMYMCLCLSLS